MRFPAILAVAPALAGRLALALECGCVAMCDPVDSARAAPERLIGERWAGVCGCVGCPRSVDLGAGGGKTPGGSLEARILRKVARVRGSRPEIIRSPLL